MTDRFVVTARELAAAQGLPEYPLVVIDHPIAGDSDEELHAKAERALAAIVSLMTSRRV
jgi:transcriptional regulator of NAD metabolism